jgi:hypothetical protein
LGAGDLGTGRIVSELGARRVVSELGARRVVSKLGRGKVVSELGAGRVTSKPEAAMCFFTSQLLLARERHGSQSHGSGIVPYSCTKYSLSGKSSIGLTIIIF